MTDTAAHVPTLNGQQDDDLINYETDDIIDHDVVGTASKIPSGADATNPATAELEIDWEDHDAGGLDTGVSAKLDDGQPGTGDGTRNLSAPVDAAPADSYLDIGLGDSLNTSEHDGITTEIAEEITYEETTARAPQDTEEDLIDYESYPDEPAPGQDRVELDISDGAELAAEDGEEPHLGEEDNSGGMGDGRDDLNTADGSEDQSEEDGGSPDTGPAAIDIMVNYRDEQFPLFHGQNNIDTQMGFFDDPAILDAAMDQLLARFREELSEDLAQQDELVLQVDEIGLEYAESTNKECLSGVTLRQIHEIFEQLAKNQDPDSTRTLYTNLIMRPHPTKRLDFLIEEGFNGKALDEVLYSFPAQIGAASHEPHEHHQHMELYEEEEEEEEEAESSQGDDDGTENNQDDDVDADQYQEEQDEEIVEVDGVDDDESGSHDQSEENGEFDAEDANEEADVDENEFEDNLDVDTRHVDQHDAFGQNPDDYTDELEAGFAPDTMGSVAPAAEDGGIETNMETHDAVADGTDNAGFDLVDFIDDEGGVMDSEAGIGAADKANTSATATLNGDVEHEITYDEDEIDVGADLVASHDVADDPAGNDTLAEIDWREPNNEAEDASKKRPFSEVEEGVSLDDETDVKRRRS